MQRRNFEWLLKLISILVIALGIVLIFIAALKLTRTVASDLVSGIITFAGGSVLNATVRENKNDLSRPRRSDEEQLQHYHFCVARERLVRSVLVLAAVVGMVLFCHWLQGGG